MKHLEHTPDFICEQGKTNYCAYVDTDSNYINAKPLLEYLWDDYKTLPNNVKDHNAEQVAFAFEKEINKYYKNLLEKDYYFYFALFFSHLTPSKIQ